MMSCGMDTSDEATQSNARVGIRFVHHKADARLGSVPAVMDGAV